ncbi:GNAT family N-acetyltransferase [Fibrella aquatilis]|uniref:GNAT family N-acetyltransferase n=1 Tax=Fibrella aquatilis TaxID=2817059 RepID=A0A939JZR8_9BACT|nr:GNAT family N-acetyltransferase [Fibrella aquatilis]MBO0931226.1 GNAT family N-acetyltransferase [Fibrella aquatilis]
MLPLLQTDRLAIAPLAVTESEFIRELVNTKGWLDFIGDRHVYSADDARTFCQAIIDSPTRHYFVVSQIETNLPLGIVSLVKRDYLDHEDIGFAFLPIHMGHGYAYEATRAVLAYLQQRPILATTVPENTNSINLLVKLGFVMYDSLIQEREKILVFMLR